MSRSMLCSRAARSLWVPILCLSFFLSALTSCKEPRKEPVPRKSQLRLVELSKMSKEPSPQIAIGADFDNKLELIGIDLKPDRVRPGDQVSITWYWRSKKKVIGDWKIFDTIKSST